ncbi:MAG: ATP-binding protein [Thermofilum sp.]|nr:ATP-binding protein [Thermofilum sp.]
MKALVDRREELKALEEWFRRGRVALLFGRRRVGKTRLVLEFIRGKRAVYLLAADSTLEYNLRKFSEELSARFGVPGLRFADFEELFRFLCSREDVDLVVIDEFGYLVRAGALPQFQRVVDLVLGSKKLLLTGSTVSAIESELLGYRSPLYGRVDLVKRLQPLRFHHLFEWFPGASFEGALAVYAATGGVPRYLEFFQRCALEEVRRVMLNPDTLPFRDAKLILEEELPEPRRYFLVLEAIASGRTRLGEIAQYSGLEPYKLTYYLGVLRDLGYVTYERPLLEGKRGVYRIADPYLAFWFRFIHPFYEELESGITAQALAYFERNFNTHLGQVFEQVAGELLLPELRFTRAGRWWKRGEEIDLVALDEDSGTAYFVEFKYSREVDAELEARRLRRKAELFGWRRGARREVYVIVARSFSRSSSEAVVIDERKLVELALRALEREASATGLSAR